jgi:FkbM family methyltransferase
MNPLITRAGRTVLRSLPKSALAYRCARAYLNWYRGENDHYESTNGESWAMKLLLPHCRVAFDVGANVGGWAAMAKLVNPGIELHCFEPSSVTFAALAQRALPGVTANRYALSSRDGDATLHLYGDLAATNSLVCDQTNSHAQLRGSERVPTKTFDTYVREKRIEHVDFVKLDVEGSEALVLEGMESSLRAGRVDVVQFEYGRFSIYGRVFLLQLFRLFRRHGFSLYKLVQDSAHLYEEYTDELESFEYQNWIAVRDAGPFADVVGRVALPGNLVNLTANLYG